MNHRYCLLLLLVLSLTFVSAPAAAQPDPGDLGVFFDPAGTIAAAPILGFVPFQFYVLAFDVPGDLKGFEFSVSVPPEIIVLARNLGPGWLNVGSLDNFIVGTGGCLSGAGAFQCVQYDGLIALPTAPPDLLICLGAATPSSFTPAVPGYLACDGSLNPFGVANTGSGVYPDGCAVGNPTAVPNFRVEAELAAGIAGVLPGQSTEIPVTLISRLFNFKTQPIPPTVSQISCTVSWDDAVASLENARLADFASNLGWTMTSTPQAGSVDLSATGPSFDAGFDVLYDIFQLELRLDPNGGSTLLTVDPTSVNNGNTDSFGTDGAFSENVVSTEQHSFGSLKARFGG